MNIIIAGVGKVGLTLARQLVAEGHDITLIDRDSLVLEAAVEQFDAMALCGNCASKEVLVRAGVENADLVIAATNADEVNLLCCMTAHGIGKRVHTIARIRNPEYAEQVMTMRSVFPLSLTVNPEKQAAVEIERLLKYPGFLRRDTFAKGRVEIVELRVDESSKLCNVALSDLSSTVKCKVLVCAVLRQGNAVAPSGNFVLKQGDRIFVTAPTPVLTELLKNLGIITRRVRSCLLCGGGRVSIYLATALANTLENAIHACEKIEQPKRYIEVKSITHPRFMLQVKNSFDGIVAFDEEGIPLAAKKGHGFGTRSIATFCNKNNAFYEFSAEENDFITRMIFNH